jgi:adenylate cyclase
MSTLTLPRIPLLPRSRRDLRFASGLVLFTYVTGHLVSHSFGLVSLRFAEDALATTAAVWQTLPGTVLLYGATLVHVGLALYAIYERRTLRMPPLNAFRIVLGLIMPLSLIAHFVGTRYAYEAYGLAPEYQRVAATLWHGGGRGLALGLLAPGWVHGCLGLRFALSSRRNWQRLRFPLFAFALLLPVLAALGFINMGRTIEAGRAAGTLREPTVTVEQVRDMVGVADAGLVGYLGLIGLVVVARLVRSLDERRRKALVRIAYPGQTVAVPRGWSVLEASRSHGIPHQSTCGGRARCTTCRVRVVGGGSHCPPPGREEREALTRIHAPAHVRLACQLRPTGEVAVEPLLAVERGGWMGAAPASPRLVEHEAALVGVAVRLAGAAAGSHAAAHDAFYVLDRHRGLVESTLEAAGGTRAEVGTRRWTYVFGHHRAPEAMARRALEVARRLEDDLAALGARLARELDVHASSSIAVHMGPVVAGPVGSADERRHLAAGDGVDALEVLLARAEREQRTLVLSTHAAAVAGLVPHDADAATGCVDASRATAAADEDVRKRRDGLPAGLDTAA